MDAVNLSSFGCYVIKKTCKCINPNKTGLELIAA